MCVLTLQVSQIPSTPGDRVSRVVLQGVLLNPICALKMQLKQWVQVSSWLEQQLAPVRDLIAADAAESAALSTSVEPVSASRVRLEHVVTALVASASVDAKQLLQISGSAVAEEQVCFVFWFVFFLPR